MKTKPFAITLDPGSSLANRTGSWRTVRPEYVDRLPPCNDACPSGENVQGWLFHAESGHYEDAWRLLTQDNPLPAVMGRVCYHPCETACNRGQLDECVGINAIERFLGDEALRRRWKFPAPPPATGKHVLVVGAGPSGLSAAYHLARHGHAVTIREAGPVAGGMMRFGIPKYRLPRDVLDAEVRPIVDLGVRIELNSKVSDVQEAMRAGPFDAVFLAVGAHIAKRAYIPAGSAAKMLDAVSVLRGMEGGEKPLLGRRVVVYGGGNTALDVARTAKRLGATDSIIVYRRTREKMPAHETELEEALQEGVLVKWLSTIKQAGEASITVEKMTLDARGNAQPTGEFETLEADSVVLALGQDVDLSLLDGVPGLEIHDGVVKVDETMMTGHPGIFAGGDMVPGERTVTVGIGHGKLAARNIHAWLEGERWMHPPRNEIAGYDKLNTWYYSDAPKAKQPVLDTIRRQSTFEEVVGSFDESTAQFEARRCLSCGNCFECDNCYGVCPDNAVIKLGPGRRYQFNYDYCKGCGLCVAECPCGAIRTVPEEIKGECPPLLFLHELERHPVRLADRDVLRVVEVRVVLLRTVRRRAQRRRQGPYAERMVLRVLRVRIDLGSSSEFESRLLGLRDDPVLRDVAAFRLGILRPRVRAMLLQCEDATRLEGVVEFPEGLLDHARRTHPAMHGARGQDQVERIGRQRGRLRAPVHDPDLAIEIGLRRISRLEVGPRLAGGFRQLRIREIGTSHIELAARALRIGRQDFGPP